MMTSSSKGGLVNAPEKIGRDVGVHHADRRMSDKPGQVDFEVMAGGGNLGTGHRRLAHVFRSKLESLCAEWHRTVILSIIVARRLLLGFRRVCAGLGKPSDASSLRLERNASAEFGQTFRICSALRIVWQAHGWVFLDHTFSRSVRRGGQGNDVTARKPFASFPIRTPRCAPQGAN